MGLVVICILVFVNAVFAASEIAFISLNRFAIDRDVEKKDKKAIKVKKILKNSSSFLATIQIGITLAGFFASALAAETYSVYVIEKLAFLNIPPDVLKIVVMFCITIILSYFTLVFGELVPKKMALMIPRKIAYLTVDIIYVLQKITYPFVWILTKSTNFVTRLFGLKEEEKKKITEEEIKLLIAEGTILGSIERGEKDLIYNVFDFNDITAKEIMVTSEKVVSIDIESSKDEMLKTIRTHKYTRMPVYKGDKNNIIGILNVKDIILNYSKNEKHDNLNLKKYLREPMYISPNKKIDDIFESMRKNNAAFAIVSNRNKTQIYGIVTLEDVIEEIMGNIFDEYDKIENEEIEVFSK